MLNDTSGCLYLNLLLPLGSRILGLGDLGINGMGISIGKLSLYIAGAGYAFYGLTLFKLSHLTGRFYSSIRPESTIPICLDLGTNTQKYLDDPFYMGIRDKRVSGQEMQDFMDEFMTEMSTAFPKMMIQFEVSGKYVTCLYPDLLTSFRRTFRLIMPLNIWNASATNIQCSMTIFREPVP